MIVSFDGDEKYPEIQVCGKATEIRELGEQLVEGTEKIVINSTEEDCDCYPVLLKGLKCNLDHFSSIPSLVKFKLVDNYLEITGGIEGLRKLGQSCINVFSDAQVDEHMHLEYYEGNSLLEETNCSVVFICNG